MTASPGELLIRPDELKTVDEGRHLRVSSLAPGMQNPIIVRKRIGDRIRFLRQRKGWSQHQLAQESGLGVRYTGSLERGEAAISIDSMKKLCDGLEMPMSALVEGVDDLSPSKLRKGK